MVWVVSEEPKCLNEMYKSSRSEFDLKQIQARSGETQPPIQTFVQIQLTSATYTHGGEGVVHALLIACISLRLTPLASPRLPSDHGWRHAIPAAFHLWPCEHGRVGSNKKFSPLRSQYPVSFLRASLEAGKIENARKIQGKAGHGSAQHAHRNHLHRKLLSILIATPCIGKSLLAY